MSALSVLMSVQPQAGDCTTARMVLVSPTMSIAAPIRSGISRVLVARFGEHFGADEPE